MGKKNKGRKGVVYSTDPDFEYQSDQQGEEETLAPAEQKLVVRIDRRQRKGKEVTLVEGFVGAEVDLKDLAKLIKTRCGTGGSVKDGIAVIQGDVREKVAAFLKGIGYRVVRGN